VPARGRTMPVDGDSQFFHVFTIILSISYSLFSLKISANYLNTELVFRRTTSLRQKYFTISVLVFRIIEL